MSARRHKRRPQDIDLDRMGLIRGIRDIPALGWTNQGHLRWLPYWMRHAILMIWNYVICHTWGHDDVLRGIECPLHCVNCCKILMPGDRCYRRARTRKTKRFSLTRTSKKRIVNP